MVLDRETIRYRKLQARDIIRRLLFNRRDLKRPIMSQEITEYVFPEYPQMSNRQWGSSVGYCKRQMGAERMQAYRRIETDGTRPDYFPASIRQWYANGNGKKTPIWTFLNAVNEPYLSRVIRQMESHGNGVLIGAGLLRRARDGNNGANNGGERE